ncbi:ABC transporter permease [Paenibacillus silviterrae]|uniref:ABC transporter permease n=1 Tax=Paenibacillus silviterrae TaxID=3242194 RepID=UPI00254294E3|nr:iron export ABC transporter permease subunit FetB [Paenibacillus chinjuensis]
MSALALLSTLAFIGIAILLSKWQKLGLERDLFIGTVRSTLQLLFVGYVLQYVFNTNHPALILTMVVLMIGIASVNAAGRAKSHRGVFWRIAVTLLFTETITMALLLGFHIIPPEPQYIIPVSGITIGSSMVVCGLLINQMKRETIASRGEIEALLALGANARQAIQEVLKRSVTFSMIPTVDTMKTIGLVQLPGMMTGMIIAGSSPVEAVKYQLLIMFILTSSSAISSIMLGMISYGIWFTDDLRLRNIP